MDSKKFELTGKIVFYSSIYGWLILLVAKLFINNSIISNLYHMFYDFAAYTFLMYIIANGYIKIKKWIINKKDF